MRTLFFLVLVIAGLAGAWWFSSWSSWKGGALGGSSQQKGAEVAPEQSVITRATFEKGIMSSSTESAPRIRGISWRERVSPISLSPPYVEQYGELKSAAEAGDARASWALYQIGERCKHVHETSADLEEASQYAYQTLMIRRPGQPDAIIAERDKVDEYVEDLLVRPFENCRGISQEMKEMRDEWLKLASEAAHTRAMVEYGQKAESKQEAMQILTNAWEMGEAFALPYLSIQYEEAYEARGYPTDKKMAYATFKVFYDLELALRGGQPSPHTANLKVRLEELAEKLLPVEVGEAGKLVDELKNNENCCLQI